MKDQKQCTKCKTFKDSNEFGVDSRSRDGLKYWCKVCANRASRQYSKTPKGMANRRKSEKAFRRRDPRKYLLRNARVRSERWGIPFSITLDDIVIPKECPILGIKIEVGNKSHDGSPTLDKIRPELGYIPSNIHVISRRANCIKSNATADEILKVGNYMKGLE